MDKDYFKAKEQLNTACEILGNNFGTPCNFGFADNFLLNKANLWCGVNCGKIPKSACWQKFFELKTAESNGCNE